MAVAKPKTKVKLRVETTGVGHARSDVSVRDVGFIIDEPTERGGTNKGPSPTETALSALAGCTNVIAHKVAKMLGIPIDNMNIRVVADFDRRGVILAEEVDVPFPKIVMDVDVETTASEADIDRLRETVTLYCPVSKVFRQAGTEIEENWNII
jgi:uncharacterized OsmC-like protein